MATRLNARKSGTADLRIDSEVSTMQFQLGQMGAAIKAAKKLAFDTGVPYYIFGSGQGGYIVDAKLPTSVKAWSRFWPDGKADNHRTPVSEHRK